MRMTLRVVDVVIGEPCSLSGSQCVRVLPRTASGLLYLRLSPMSADATTKFWTVGVQIRLNRWKSARHFKATFCAAISDESLSQPGQAVGSPRAMRTRQVRNTR